MVAESAVLNEQTIVVLVHALTLIIQADKTVQKLATDKGIVDIQPAARDTIYDILVIIRIAGLGDCSHKAHVLETVVGKAATQCDHIGPILRSRLQRHVLEGHVIGAIQGQGAICGIACITSHNHLLVVIAHTSEYDAIGGARS